MKFQIRKRLSPLERFSSGNGEIKGGIECGHPPFPSAAPFPGYQKVFLTWLELLRQE